MGSLYQKLFRVWCFTANSAEHKGGRLTLAWNTNSFQCNILYVSSQLIQCYVQPSGGAGSFFFSLIYSFNHGVSRKLVWKDLEDLSQNIMGPWMIVADFNCVISPEERIRAVVRPHETFDLQKCMIACGMRDLQSSGSLFTWNNKQHDDHRVFCKLDRVMVNDSQFLYFPSAMAHFTPEGRFDHTPIVIKVYLSIELGKQHFKYYTMWSGAANFSNIITECQNPQVARSHMYKLVSRMKNIK